MNLKRLLIFPVFLGVTGISFCQESYKDTLTVTLQRVDSIFISQNLTLLAEKCNIESSKALIIQAKLFKNINFSISQNVHNPYYETMRGKQWFDFTDKGETVIAVQKLFLIAGKRNKQIGLAQSGALKEEQYYFDLLRTLKFSLHSQFSNIYYLGQIIKVYEREISSLNKLSLVFQAEEGKGFISKKEVLRIKASLFSLENEKLGYITQMISAQTELNTLLHTTNLFYLPVWMPDSSYKNSPESFKLQDLIDTAYMYRYDLKMARSDFDISNLNLSYQKALAIPDVTVSGGWDKNGGYFHNYNYVGLSFDLPLFDRNQGNIKSAKFNAESNRYKVETAGDQVKADVINAVSNAIETNRLYFRFDKTFLSDLKSMNDEMLKNFEKRNISLIEFLDYYDAYKTNAIQLNTLMYNRINSFENINFAVGKDIMTR